VGGRRAGSVKPRNDANLVANGKPPESFHSPWVHFEPGIGCIVLLIPFVAALMARGAWLF
jgi:hypothetical protein